MNTLNFKTVSLFNFESHDDKGNYVIASFGFDKEGNHVATTYSCDKDECNCAGIWSDGFVDDVYKTVNREDVNQ